ncbi:MAG: uroporphyrinogen-III synthase, partial [Alphaproteobacteria bacterium]|nr:uroporphyrinogen-III synthase [Alphaproteobacteria bacterium]
MNVLVTRPQGDAEETAARLIALGHRPALWPLIRIEFLDGPELALDGTAAVLATSANGVRAFARRTRERNIELFAIGSRTAEEARAHGFLNTSSADGNSQDLADFVAGRLRSGSQLVHATSTDGPGTLASALIGRGFRVEVAALYETVGATSVPGEIAAL